MNDLSLDLAVSTVAGVTPNIEWARKLFLEIERLASCKPGPGDMERIQTFAGIGSHLLEDVGEDLGEVEGRFE